MPKKEYSKQEIDKLIQENEFLRKENYGYKKIVSSRRHQYAEKIATAYNRVFPKWTKRRTVFEETCKVCIKPFAKYKAWRGDRFNRKINKLVKNYDKVMVIDSIPWDDKLRQRPHHLAAEFRKLGFFVVYFEGSNSTYKMREVGDGIVTINSHLMLADLPKECPNCFFLLPNTMATPLEVVNQVKEYGYKLIYEYIDEFHGDISGDLGVQLSIWNELNNLKPVLLVASALKLKEDLEEHLGKKYKIVLAPNAVFTEHFNYKENETETPPNDMKDIVKNGCPIIGFYGALAPWIDFDLINTTAKKHPEWEFVFLGIDYNNAAKDLAKGKNIHNLGAKQYEELPRYSKYFNCAMIPFKHGEIAKATSPIKLFEYMAAGLPTVCTRDLRECRGYDYVYMAKDAKEFEKYMGEAIKEYNNDAARSRLLEQAEKNTWSQRAADIVAGLGL